MARNSGKSLIGEQKEKSKCFHQKQACLLLGQKGDFILFTVSKNKANSMSPKRQHPVGKLRIYLTELIKFQDGTLSQEICNIQRFQRLQMSSRVHCEHQETHSGAQCEDSNDNYKWWFNFCRVEEN